MAEIQCGVVQPDYSGCCDGPVVGVTQVPVVGPPGPPGPPGPQGPPGENGGSSCPVYCGVGEPEGVQTSIVGGLYLQTDRAATSHPFFAKRTGTGNVGWRGWGGLRGAGVGSFAIGDNSAASGVDSIAFGENTTATGARSEAFGKSSSAIADDAKAFGAGAQALGVSSYAGGLNAVSRRIDDIAIGHGADAGATNEFDDGTEEVGRSIAIGFNARASKATIDSNYSPDCISIGTNALAQLWSSIAMGTDSIAQDDKAIAIGYSAQTQREFEGLIAPGVISIGANSRAQDSGVTIGKNSITQGEETNACTVVGSESFAIGDCNVAIGFDTTIWGNGCLAIGTHAGVYGKGNDPFGVPTAIGGESDAIGSFAFVDRADGALALGPRARVDMNCNYSISIGHNSRVHNYSAIALGTEAETNRKFSLMIGGALAAFGGNFISGIHFNGAATPAIIVNPDGTVRINSTDGAIATKTADYTLLGTDKGVYVDATTGNVVITLPDWLANPASLPWIRRLDNSANTVTVQVASGSGEELYDRESLTYSTFQLLPSQYSTIVIQRLTGATGHPKRWSFYLAV